MENPLTKEQWLQLAALFSKPWEERTLDEKWFTSLGICCAAENVCNVNVTPYFQSKGCAGYMFPVRFGWWDNETKEWVNQDPDWIPYYDIQRAKFCKKEAKRLL